MFYGNQLQTIFIHNTHSLQLLLHQHSLQFLIQPHSLLILLEQHSLQFLIQPHSLQLHTHFISQLHTHLIWWLPHSLPHFFLSHFKSACDFWLVDDMKWVCVWGVWFSVQNLSVGQTRWRHGCEVIHAGVLALEGPWKKFQFFSKNPKFLISWILVLASP